MLHSTHKDKHCVNMALFSWYWWYDLRAETRRGQRWGWRGVAPAAPRTAARQSCTWAQRLWSRGRGHEGLGLTCPPSSSRRGYPWAWGRSWRPSCGWSTCPSCPGRRPSPPRTPGSWWSSCARWWSACRPSAPCTPQQSQSKHYCRCFSNHFSILAWIKDLSCYNLQSYFVNSLYLRGEGDLGAGILLAVDGVGVAEVPAGVDAALLLGAQVAQLALRCNGDTVWR